MVPRAPSQAEIRQIIKEMNDMKELFAASFTITTIRDQQEKKEVKAAEEEERSQVTGTELSAWAAEPENSKDNNILKKFNDELKIALENAKVLEGEERRKKDKKPTEKPNFKGKLKASPELGQKLSPIMESQYESDAKSSLEGETLPYPPKRTTAKYSAKTKVPKKIMDNFEKLKQQRAQRDLANTDAPLKSKNSYDPSLQFKESLQEESQNLAITKSSDMEIFKYLISENLRMHHIEELRRKNKDGLTNIPESGVLDIDLQLMEFLEARPIFAQYIKDHLQDLKPIHQHYIRDLAIKKKEKSEPKVLQENSLEKLATLIPKIKDATDGLNLNDPEQHDTAIKLFKGYHSLTKKYVNDVTFWLLSYDEKYRKKDTRGRQTNYLQRKFLDAQVLQSALDILNKKNEKLNDPKVYLNEQVNWLKERSLISEEEEKAFKKVMSKKVTSDAFKSFQEQINKKFKQVNMKDLLALTSSIQEENEVLITQRLLLMKKLSQRPQFSDQEKKLLKEQFHNNCIKNLFHKVKWITLTETWDLKDKKNSLWTSEDQKTLEEISHLPFSDPKFDKFVVELEKKYEEAQDRTKVALGLKKASPQETTPIVESKYQTDKKPDEPKPSKKSWRLKFW